MIPLLFLGILLVYRNVLQGIGRVGFPVISGVVELIVRASAAILLAKYLGYTGICFATPLAWISGAIVLAFGYKLCLYSKIKNIKI